MTITVITINTIAPLEEGGEAADEGASAGC